MTSTRLITIFKRERLCVGAVRYGKLIITSLFTTKFIWPCGFVLERKRGARELNLNFLKYVNYFAMATWSTIFRKKKPVEFALKGLTFYSNLKIFPHWNKKPRNISNKFREQREYIDNTAQKYQNKWRNLICSRLVVCNEESPS